MVDGRWWMENRFSYPLSTIKRAQRADHPQHTAGRERHPSLSLAFIVGLLALLPACGYYSFTGATIPANLDTIAIPLVQDNSLSPLTALDEEMTRRLIDRFVQQTRLSLETNEEEADAVLTATLDRYANVPTSVTGEERAQRNRVTITVSVRYYDRTEDEELLQRTFSSFEDYDPVVDGLDGERVAALAALENIADDIFTAATSNW